MYRQIPQSLSPWIQDLLYNCKTANLEIWVIRCLKDAERLALLRHEHCACRSRKGHISLLAERYQGILELGKRKV